MNNNINLKTGKPKVSSRGGARPNAGRKPGGSNKLKLEDLLKDIELHTNMTFSQRIATNYLEAIQRGDHAGVRDYDKILLGKLVADKQEVEVTNTTDAVEAKREAFADAVAALSASNIKSIVPARTESMVNKDLRDGSNG